MKKEHILVIRFSALGDVAMVVPVVDALARQYPDVRITVLSREFARPLFADLQPNVGFMAADLNKEYRGIKGLNALYRRLTAKQFTAIADLHSVLRSEYLRMRFNLGRFHVAHINKHRRERRQLVSSQNKQLKQLPTAFQNYADVFAQLGYPIQLDFQSIFSTPPLGTAADLPMDNAQQQRGNLNLLPAIIGPKNGYEQWIGIAPFAAHRGKVYPPEQMWRVIELLVAKHPHARIFLFGRGKCEDQTFTQWCSQLKQCVYVSRCLEAMYQELILMSHLDVMVSMDSANMHLTSLTATPVVSIWGATHPYAGFMGWNQPAENAIQTDDLSCRPCSIYGQKSCLRGDYACMYRIQPEHIVARVEEILKK
ncbi:MAG: glycosyltransferase family 9 protein [Prevotella sp.]|nr:glycosyltransferase family 9 protein [Prevotella sp.]